MQCSLFIHYCFNGGSDFHSLDKRFMELICECGYFKSGYNRDHVIVLNKMVNEFLQSTNHMKLAIVSGSSNIMHQSAFYWRY